MNKKQIAAKLREALALMNDRGAHWIKGEFEEEIFWDEEGEPVEYGYCALGAIRKVTDTPVWDPSEASNELAFALAEVLPPIDAPAGYIDSMPLDTVAFDKIVSWNDNEDREWNQVVEAFEKAARKLEQEA